MELAWLDATDFRNHAELSMRPDPGVNVLIGANGSGKTSVLEAIGYLATLRSFRRSPDAALIREGADAAITRGEFTSAQGTALVEIENPREGRRRVLLNGSRPRSRAAVAEVVALVAFLPDDLDLVKRGPAYRREYIDDLAAQVWPAAAAEQQEYERAVRQRNALLKREGRHADPTTLDVLDERVSRLGADVLLRRLAVVDAAAPVVAGLYRDLAEESGDVVWRYESAGLGELSDGPSREEMAADLHEAVTSARAKDLERRITTVGPHRDEIVFELSGRDARTRASQGEQRSIALGLRIAAYRVVEERRGVPPILLLDDVFSELDEGRARRLVATLPGGQVFVTSAREEEVPMHGRQWRVEEGKVLP